jgi:fucose permease
LVSLGIAAANVVVQAYVFQFKHQDECLVEAGYQPGARNTDEDRSNIRQMMSLKTVHLLATFIFIYVGIEVTIGGWIVTYIIEERGGGPSAGYISSGFFGGLTLGRILLLWVNEKVGERRVIFLYTGLAIILELTIWFVPSLVGGAVAVSLVGLLLGPYFPIAVNHAGRVLPRWLLTASIGWIAGLGQAGTAVLPFFTGALAGRWGIAVLHPL